MSALALQGIGKAFAGVRVLDDVSLNLDPGEVVGVVGENGAGKSTLMNIVGGLVTPDAGTMSVAGRPYVPRMPHDAAAIGIAFVHQELNLFPNLSIAENLHLTAFPRRAGRPWIDRAALRTRAARLLASVGLDRDPALAVGRLTIGERQLVEMARALGADARILILDEPATSLSANEREGLFALMADLRSRGLAIVYISHDLADVLRMCDRVVVMRDGQVVAVHSAAEWSTDRLISAMVGRELSRVYSEPPAVDAAAGAALQVRSLTRKPAVRDVTLSVGSGEILGLAGLMGAGRSELARVIFGLDAADRGEVRLEGDLLTGGPRPRIARGLALVTEDRRDDGLCLDATVADNLLLVALRAFCRTPLRFVRTRAVAAAIGRLREAVRLSPSARDGQAVRTLSGGNQQKVVLGRWLLARPKVLILDEPTRGIDVGAKVEIYQLVHRLAAGGAGILLISSEIEELIGLCHRILVMRQGAVASEVRRGAFDRERLLRDALPSGGTIVTPPAPHPGRRRLWDLTPALLLAGVLLAFGWRADAFLTPANLVQILAQTAPTAVVATGMTFVLLTAGVDLSVGAVMFVGAGLAGTLLVRGQPLGLALAAMLATGLTGGALNAWLVTRLRLVPFIATLSLLYIGRGTGRWITETRAMNLPDAFLRMGSASWLGLPLPVWVAAVVMLVAHGVLARTPFGRQVYAVGASREGARTAGVDTGRVLTAVYVICGGCAGLGGLLALAQLGAVSPRFGELYEFDAITAAVLGGTSLFGGRGSVLPGTLIGALLLKAIFSGLVIVQADPYVYPLVTAGIIFLAVLVDSLRTTRSSPV